MIFLLSHEFVAMRVTSPEADHVVLYTIARPERIHILKVKYIITQSIQSVRVYSQNFYDADDHSCPLVSHEKGTPTTAKTTV